MTEEPILTALDAIRAGESGAVSRLVSLVYGDLHRLAAYRLAHLPPGQTLTPTELVHETFARIVRLDGRTWEDRRHFIDAAGTAMRSILVDRARARSRLKRRADGVRVDLDLVTPTLSGSEDDDRIEAIDSALRALEAVDARAARVVTMKFFLGLEELEISNLLGVTERTVRRDWAYAKTWLKAEVDRMRTERET